MDNPKPLDSSSAPVASGGRMMASVTSPIAPRTRPSPARVVLAMLVGGFLMAILGLFVGFKVGVALHPVTPHAPPRYGYVQDRTADELDYVGNKLADAENGASSAFCGVVGGVAGTAIGAILGAVGGVIATFRLAKGGVPPQPVSALSQELK